MKVERYAVVAGGEPVLSIRTLGIERTAQFGGTGTTIVPISVALDDNELGTVSEKELLKGRDLSTPDGWTLRVQHIAGRVVAFRDGRPVPAIAKDLALKVGKGMLAGLLIAVQAIGFAVWLYLEKQPQAAGGVAGAAVLLAVLALLGRRGAVPLGPAIVLGSLLGALEVLLVAVATNPAAMGPALLYVCAAIVWLVNAGPASRALRGRRVRPPVQGPLRLLMLTVIATGIVVAIVALIFLALWLSHRNREDRSDREIPALRSVG